MYIDDFVYHTTERTMHHSLLCKLNMLRAYTKIKTTYTERILQYKKSIPATMIAHKSFSFSFVLYYNETVVNFMY